MSTPSQKLAVDIVDQLVGQELLTIDDSLKVLAKIEEGKMRPEDWRLAIEKALAWKNRP